LKSTSSTVRPSIREWFNAVSAGHAVLVFFLALVASVVISFVSVKQEAAKNIELTHKSIARQIVPALKIANYAEVERILALAAQDSVVFAVVSLEGDLILADYQQRLLFESFLAAIRSGDAGECLQKTTNEGGYQFCTVLRDEDNLMETAPVGHLLSVANGLEAGFSLPVFLLAMTIISIFILSSTVWLRTQFNRVVIKPIEDLSNAVLSDGQIELAAHRVLPQEISKIKERYDSLIRSEKESIYRQQETERYKALHDLARQVAHDIRAPLGALEMALRGLSELDQERKSLAGLAIERINKIANDLIQRTKPKPVEAAGESFDLAMAIEEIVTEKRATLPPGIQIEIKANSRPDVRFSKSELQRILSNLMNNSLEAMPSGGQIFLELTQELKCVQITVRDTGHGMPPERISQLGRAGVSFGKSNGESGSGLGLAHAKHTIERWGGNLEIESELGRGTSVRMQIPKGV
jgi:signal transduction histidine kinase